MTGARQRRAEVAQRPGRNGWVRISLPTARPGDLIWLAGINHHYYSHVITLGKTPRDARVEEDHPGR